MQSDSESRSAMHTVCVCQQFKRDLSLLCVRHPAVQIVAIDLYWHVWMCWMAVRQPW